MYHNDCCFILKTLFIRPISKTVPRGGKKMAEALNVSLHPEKENVMQMDDFSCTPHVNNPAQMPPCKSLNAAGKWAFLPCPTVPRRWSKRLSLCNFTPCSVPAEPSFQRFSHDLRGEERRETHAPSLSFFTHLWGNYFWL